MPEPLDLKLRNVGLLTDADLVVGNGITLVCGPNEAGKSTVLEVLGALLTGEAAFRTGTKAKDGPTVAYAASEQKMALAELAGGGGAIRIRWPSCEVGIKGNPPYANALAAGRAKLATMSHAERAAMMRGILRIAVPPERLVAELEALKTGATGERLVTDEEVGRISAATERQGWDATEKAYREDGAAAKGRWEEVTGCRWGAQQAERWLFDHHGEFLEPAAEAKLRSHVESAGERLAKAARKAGATMEARRQQTIRLSQLDAHRVAAETALAELQELQKRVTEAEERLHSLSPIEGTSRKCPHKTCGLPIVVTDELKLLVPPKTATVDQASYQKQLDGLERARAKVAKLAAIKWTEQDSTEREKLIIELAKPVLDSRLDEEAIEAERKDQVEQLGRHERLVNARSRHADVVRSLAVAQVLGKDGLRRKVAEEAIGSLNGTLELWSEHLKIPTVTLDSDFAPLCGDEPYAALADSLKLKVDAMIAAAAAERDGSALIVLDRLDCLTKRSKNLVLKWLAKVVTVPAVLAWHVGDQDQAPDLAAAKLGRTYWLQPAQAWVPGRDVRPPSKVILLDASRQQQGEARAAA